MYQAIFINFLSFLKRHLKTRLCNFFHRKERKDISRAIETFMDSVLKGQQNKFKKRKIFRIFRKYFTKKKKKIN